MSTANPYAPPTAFAEPVSSATFQRPDADRLQRARARLANHLVNEENRRSDLALSGPRISLGAKISGGLLVASGIAVTQHVAFIAGIVIFAILFAVLFIRDLMIGPRTADTTPLVAFKNHMRAARWGNDGYLLSTLAPTGREENASPPDLTPVPVGAAGGALSSKETIKAFFRTFLRPGTGQYRWSKIHKPELVEESGDVAYVRAKVVVNAVPQWAYSVSIVAFVVVRLIGLILLAIVMTAMKKSATVHVTKTFIKGSDGLWYALQGGWDGEVERA